MKVETVVHVLVTLTPTEAKALQSFLAEWDDTSDESFISDLEVALEDLELLPPDRVDYHDVR